MLLTILATGGLAAYVHLSSSFGSTYGPLAGIIALLLWSLLSAIALFYGVAVCAQLEALRAGDGEPAYDDPGRPHGQSVDRRPACRGGVDVRVLWCGADAAACAVQRP